MSDLPEIFNAASYFVDRHIIEGRGAAISIECGSERVSYQQVFEQVNRFGAALRTQLGVPAESASR
ncbi:MAG: Benzoate-CoA ligase [Acidobacteriota bacterium]